MMLLPFVQLCAKQLEAAAKVTWDRLDKVCRVPLVLEGGPERYVRRCEDSLRDAWGSEGNFLRSQERKRVAIRHWREACCVDLDIHYEIGDSLLPDSDGSCTGIDCTCF